MVAPTLLAFIVLLLWIQHWKNQFSCTALKNLPCGSLLASIPLANFLKILLVCCCFLLTLQTTTSANILLLFQTCSCILNFLGGHIQEQLPVLFSRIYQTQINSCVISFLLKQNSSDIFWCIVNSIITKSIVKALYGIHLRKDEECPSRQCKK